MYLLEHGIDRMWTMRPVMVSYRGIMDTSHPMLVSHVQKPRRSSYMHSERTDAHMKIPLSMSQRRIHSRDSYSPHLKNVFWAEKIRETEKWSETLRAGFLTQNEASLDLRPWRYSIIWSSIHTENALERVHFYFVFIADRIRTIRHIVLSHSALLEAEPQNVYL